MAIRSGPAALRYSIGEVAALTGCSAASIRRWEHASLLHPTRSSNGYRAYEDADVRQVKRIAYLRNVQKLNIAAIRRIIPRREVRSRPSRRPGREIGPELRRLRLERSLTLQQAASGSELSPSYLSSLERNQTGVSVSTLRRLLAFYGTSLNVILGGKSGTGRGHLTRPGHRPVLTNRWAGVTIEQLAAGAAVMEVQLFTIEPRSGSDGSYSHDGEEFIYVLEGEVEVRLGGTERHPIKPGDCLYFPSTVEHSWRNPGSKVARLLWVNTPPTF